MCAACAYSIAFQLIWLSRQCGNRHCEWRAHSSTTRTMRSDARRDNPSCRRAVHA
jgi:hypothetical protein